MEYRSGERFRRNLKGRIAYDENRPAVDCLMRGLSTAAARLVFQIPPRSRWNSTNRSLISRSLRKGHRPRFG